MSHSRSLTLLAALFILGGCGPDDSQPVTDTGDETTDTSTDVSDTVDDIADDTAIPVCSDDTADAPCSCGDETCVAGELCNGGVCAPPCETLTPWGTGTPLFREVTHEWGLDGAEGVRLNVVNVDGDMWPDLLVRRGAGHWEESDRATRYTWLLRNTGEGGFEDLTDWMALLTARSAVGTTRGRPVEIAAFGDVNNDGDVDPISVSTPATLRNEREVRS